MQDKWERGFLKTKRTLGDRIKEIFTGTIDDVLYEELTECLVLADVPYLTAEQLIEASKGRLSKADKMDLETVKRAIAESARSLFDSQTIFKQVETPALILMIGVNGAGKTTTIAKLTHLFLQDSKRVLLAAGDTFRAAANEQLSIWADRLDVPIINSTEGQDSSSVFFDAIQSAQAKKYDVVLCDTAGRLQNKKNLMNELEKIYRVAEKNKGDIRLYTVLVLDAMSGQSSLNQLRLFTEVATIDGLILTKTDGSAKGGVLLGIASEFDIPVWYVGTGENLDDLEPFDADEYIKAIL
jgi:fused signal recognition particle receptor